MSLNLELDDAIVLLIGAKIKGLSNEVEIKGITRLEKLMFLLEKETLALDWLKDNSEFEPRDLGPFSAKIYQTVDILLSAELIKERRTISSDNLDGWEQDNLIGSESDSFVIRNFRLTKKGEQYYDVLVKDMDKRTLAEIASFKNRFAFLPIRQLVRYVHLNHPEFTLAS